MGEQWQVRVLCRRYVVRQSRWHAIPPVEALSSNDTMKVFVDKECNVEVVVEAIGSVVDGGKSRWLRGASLVY